MPTINKRVLEYALEDPQRCLRLVEILLEHSSPDKGIYFEAIPKGYVEISDIERSEKLEEK